MVVDFPLPDGPTSAVVVPLEHFNEKSLRIRRVGRDGYRKPTSLNSMLPITSF